VINDVVVVDPRKARELLDAEQPAELLAIVTAEEVGLAWCRYAERTVAASPTFHDWDADPDGWAAELYQEDELFWADENFVRTFLTTIVEAAPNDEVLGWVGAGPLQDFIIEDRDRLAWVIAQASRSERFRRALSSVSIHDRVSSETALWVERETGLRWHWPDFYGPRPVG
jgi:hypothetical protein